MLIKAGDMLLPAYKRKVFKCLSPVKEKRVFKTLSFLSLAAKDS